jgi:hypothetical protein
MPTEDTAAPQPDLRRCPVCWTWFTPNSPSNPYPRRYCCGACRIQDSRRRREAEQTQLVLDATLDVLRTTRHPEAERRETTQTRHLLDERRHPMNPE